MSHDATGIQLDPKVPLYALRTQEAQIADSVRREDLMARLASMLGAVTLVLCAIGLFGLLAGEVARRTPEIGLRIALGAELGHVRWMVKIGRASCRERVL